MRLLGGGLGFGGALLGGGDLAVGLGFDPLARLPHLALDLGLIIAARLGDRLLGLDPRRARSAVSACGRAPRWPAPAPSRARRRPLRCCASKLFSARSRAASAAATLRLDALQLRLGGQAGGALGLDLGLGLGRRTCASSPAPAPSAPRGPASTAPSAAATRCSETFTHSSAWPATPWISSRASPTAFSCLAGSLGIRAGSLILGQHYCAPAAGGAFLEHPLQDLAGGVARQLVEELDLARRLVAGEVRLDVGVERRRRSPRLPPRARRRPSAAGRTRSSSTPITATSTTASRSASRSSTSRGKTFSPPETIISSSRPSMKSRPAASKWPTSPLESRPSIASLPPPPV